MPQAKAAIEALDADHARAAIAGEREIGIAIDGNEHTLHPEDMTLVMQPLDGYQVEAEAGRAVALALELDDELIREGLAREVVRAVQNARKDAGLEITDRIALAPRRRRGAARRRPRPRGLRDRRDPRHVDRARRRGRGPRRAVHVEVGGRSRRSPSTAPARAPNVRSWFPGACSGTLARSARGGTVRGRCSLPEAG